MIGACSAAVTFPVSSAWSEFPKPSAGSLEDLFHRTGLPYAFLDLSRSSHLPGWLRGPIIARPLKYMEMRARWGRVYDAVLFFDRMTVSEKQ